MPRAGHTERPRGRIWHADAQAELIFSALQMLGVEAPVVVGHSWGTMVATALALAHPESVRRLVLIAGYYFPTPRPDVLLAAIPAIPGIGTLMRNIFSPLIGRASAADTAMMIPQAMHMADCYGELHMPVTILAGKGAGTDPALQESAAQATLPTPPVSSSHDSVTAFN